MFCSSDSWDSAMCLSSEARSPPLVMEAFYFLYSPSPLFTGVRGREILRTSPLSDSAKFTPEVATWQMRLARRMPNLHSRRQEIR